MDAAYFDTGYEYLWSGVVRSRVKWLQESMPHSLVNSPSGNDKDQAFLGSHRQQRTLGTLDLGSLGLCGAL